MRLFLTVGERYRKTVVDHAPRCFGLPRWQHYLGSWVRVPFVAEAQGPARRPAMISKDHWEEIRQARATRVMACEDCTLRYQLAMKRDGLCSPVSMEHTPLGRLMTVMAMARQIFGWGDAQVDLDNLSSEQVAQLQALMEEMSDDEPDTQPEEQQLIEAAL